MVQIVLPLVYTCAADIIKARNLVEHFTPGVDEEEAALAGGEDCQRHPRQRRVVRPTVALYMYDLSWPHEVVQDGVNPGDSHGLPGNVDLVSEMVTHIRWQKPTSRRAGGRAAGVHAPRAPNLATCLPWGEEATMDEAADMMQCAEEGARDPMDVDDAGDDLLDDSLSIFAPSQSYEDDLNETGEEVHVSEAASDHHDEAAEHEVSESAAAPQEGHEPHEPADDDPVRVPVLRKVEALREKLKEAFERIEDGQTSRWRQAPSHWCITMIQWCLSFGTSLFPVGVL